MHEGEVDIDLDLVRRLLDGQFPELANLPLEPVASVGTVNAHFRLGDDLCVRLPRLQQWAASLDREWEWLPRLAPCLSMRIPEPIAKGKPTASYPLPWAIYRWIEGQTYADALLDDELQAAEDLAQFVRVLRVVDAGAEAPRAGRRPIAALDAITHAAIDSARRIIDRDASIAAWERALVVPSWDGTPVWIHSDLLRPNLLVRDGRLCAVLDFGGVGAGDPAFDVIPAWSVFGPSGRRVFRKDIDVDDSTWNRARGYALHQAALILPYYIDTNPEFAEMAIRTIEQILADFAA